MANLIFILLISWASGNDTRVITGELIIYETNKPAIGATILIDGTSEGVTADSLGHFTLITQSKFQALEIQLIGYSATRIVLPPQTNIEFGSIKLFRNFNRTIMAHGLVERKLLKDKSIYYELESRDSLKHIEYRNVIIPKECFSYSGSFYKYKPTAEDEITLNLNEPKNCQYK
jgi:hypothetical protein